MKALVIRIGEAYGDIFVITPLLRHLKAEGHHITVLVGNAGREILKNNPNVDRVLYHRRDSVSMEDLQPYFERIQREEGCDLLVNLVESFECEMVYHPVQPQYNYPLAERHRLVGQRNCYEVAFEKANRPPDTLPPDFDFTPDIFFTEEEEEISARYRQQFIGKQVVMWGLSGSAMHKAYPYVPYVMNRVIQRTKDVIFVTVGDESCQILEVELEHPRVVNKSGRWSFRESTIQAKYSALVVGPDTGLLHAAGCFETPKIGLLSTNSIENITKHFKNDLSQEATCACAPCHRIIYNSRVQCPVDPVTSAPICMAEGQNPDDLALKILRLVELRERSNALQRV